MLAEAHNTGFATRNAANGLGIARVIEQSDASDPTCQRMNGKMISLADLRLRNPNHPICLGGLTPVFGDQPDAITGTEAPKIPGGRAKDVMRRH